MEHTVMCSKKLTCWPLPCVNVSFHVFPGV